LGNLNRKTQFGRSRHRRVDNIKTDFQETSWEDMDWTDMAQDGDMWQAIANMVNIWVL
jgi:hypothetical protein